MNPASNTVEETAGRRPPWLSTVCPLSYALCQYRMTFGWLYAGLPLSSLPRAVAHAE
jgi:hypothetical protein